MIEGQRWIVTLAGVLGDHPPADPAGFEAFARSLPVPDVHDAIAGAEPLTDPLPFRFPASVRRRYERSDRFPERLLVLGDAFCSLNPVYGQGMTLAALQARALRRHLRSGPPAPRAFHRDIARIVDGSWDMVVGGDLAFPGVDDTRTARIRIVNGYLRRVQAAAADDAEIATAFVRVAGLMDRPVALLRPRLLRHARRMPTGADRPGQGRPAGGGRVRTGRGGDR